MKLALVFFLLMVVLVQTKKPISKTAAKPANSHGDFIMSQVFEIGKQDISDEFAHQREFQRSTFLCEVFLLYNDTTVDVAHSNIECNITGNATNFSTGRKVESKTGFQFVINFSAKLSKGGVESKLSSAQIESTPDENVIITTSKLVNFTKIDELTDITEKQKEEIKSNLVKDIVAFNKHERAAEENRFKKRWVQSNFITNRIGKNARLRETINLSINNTRNSFKPQRPTESATESPRQISNSFTVDDFLEDIRVSCELGVNTFNGGLIGANVICDATANDDRYRRIDGVCNNLNNKHFGATGIAMRRLLPQAYADGGFVPRHSSVGPRTISNNLHSKTGGPNDGASSNIPTTKGVTHMTMQFGQFLDHDITITPQAELDCCNATFLAIDQAQDPHLQRCFNIPVQQTTFPGTCSNGPCCHSFTRSDHICDDSTHREQFNGLTAFVDGSNIYGSDEDTSQKLRTLSDGLMQKHTDFPIQNLPSRSQCGFASPGSLHEDDLVAGDVRAIVQPTLASMHTLFLNEHNRIATELKSRLGSALASVSNADEFLFQETRKIVGAELQNIVYKEYLPVVLGSAAMSANNLNFGDETSYNPNTDPSILNEFSTVAYRFGHSTVRDIINGWPLQKHFLVNPPDHFIVGDNGKKWMREMQAAIVELSPKNDLIIGDALRNHLFNPPHSLPEDLPARNIQRAREHGIPTYGHIRGACGLSGLVGINPPPEINQTSWDALMATFSPDNIEPFTAGLAENAPSDGLVGPLFACIIGRQFQRLKDGDRFFYTHTTGDNARGLGENTKESVLRRTLGHIICDNTDAESTQIKVFKENSMTDNPHENCEDIVGLDFDCIVNDLIGAIFMNGTVSCHKTTTTTTTSTTTITTTSTISITTTSTTTTTITNTAVTKTTTTTTVPEPLLPTPIHQAPGQCLKKDISPVELGDTWHESCKDEEGNSYLEGTSLMSCCGCFSYVCTMSQDRPYLPSIFNWTKALAPTCCQTCNGTVVPDGTIIAVEALGDKCGTVKTSICKIRNRIDNNGNISAVEVKGPTALRDGDAAVARSNMIIAANIEEEYHYDYCCVDENGLHQINDNVPDPSTCSTRTCEMSEGWAHAAWVTTQQFSGCGCCIVDGKMVPDGFSWKVGRYPVETWECCRGKVVVVKEETQSIH